MRAKELLVRILMQWAMFAVGATIYLTTTPLGAAWWILILPILLGVPGTIVSAAVLAPLESWLERRRAGGWTYIILPIVAGLVPWALFPLAGNLQNFLAGAPMLSGIALAWGILWVVSRLLYRVGAGEAQPA